MAQVGTRDFHTSPQPIITKKAWFIIISAIVFLGLYLGVSEQTSKSPDGLTRYFIDIGNALTTLLASVNSVPRAVSNHNYFTEWSLSNRLLT